MNYLRSLEPMHFDKYLKRIQFYDSGKVDRATLDSVHRCHVHHVPFENLDIQSKKIFDLEIANIFHKVVDNNRGGFCYELNLLFNELLNSLGFRSSIIEARIFTDKGDLGPRYDHMSLLVELDKLYLADVGFGDLFLKPLEVREGEQSDGRNVFKIEQVDANSYLLMMSKEDRSFEKKYVFDVRSVRPDDFNEICFEKQINPDSYFVKNLVCTQPTESGRITIFNNSMIERRGAERQVTKINDDEHLREILLQKFRIDFKVFYEQTCSSKYDDR